MINEEEKYCNVCGSWTPKEFSTSNCGCNEEASKLQKEQFRDNFLIISVFIILLVSAYIFIQYFG